MLSLDNEQLVLLVFVRAGLWGTKTSLSLYGDVDFEKIMRLADEQSIVGLVTEGLEKVGDGEVPKEELLSFIGVTLQIELRNKEMNEFIVKLTKLLSTVNVFSLLIKGQGVALCYEKPLWRTAGDVDLLLDVDDYEKAKKELFPKAYDIQKENQRNKHQAMKIMGFDVELHGRMPFSLSRMGMKVNEEVVADSLNCGGVSVMTINETEVFTPNPDNHIFLVFTHYLLHFFVEGVGLRQICDWCRMLWTYREELDLNLLESRLKRSGLMTEWKVFGAMAVSFLGMPVEAMPFYDSRYKTRGEKVIQRILENGNFGHSRDLSYRTKYKGAAYKVVATWRRFRDFVRFVPIFPLDAPRFFVTYVLGKVR